jgi:hypothetical protein
MTRLAKRAPRLAAVGLGAAAWLSAGSACGGSDDCEFDSVLRDTGGVGLTDCKIARVDDTEEVDACAVSAYRARQTFRAIYEQEDGGLRAIVHAAGDSYHVVTLADDGSIARAECGGGVLVQENGRSYIDCDEPGEFRDVCE